MGAFAFALTFFIVGLLVRDDDAPNFALVAGGVVSLNPSHKVDRVLCGVVARTPHVMHPALLIHAEGLLHLQVQLTRKEVPPYAALLADLPDHLARLHGGQH